MADYYTPTVIQQTIPDADMTPLERLLLSHVFSAERDGDSWYFYSEDGPTDIITVDRIELEAALAVSLSPEENSANLFVIEQIAGLRVSDTPAAEIDLDLGVTSWEFFIQDIVRRSSNLRYVTAVSSFTCSRMRPDGFGGLAVLITADVIVGKSTHDLLADFLSEAGLDQERTTT